MESVSQAEEMGRALVLGKMPNTKRVTCELGKTLAVFSRWIMDLEEYSFLLNYSWFLMFVVFCPTKSQLTPYLGKSHCSQGHLI